MSTTGTLLVGLVMLVGLLGVLVPGLPGLILVLGAGLAWVLLDGPGTGHWTVFAVMLALFVVGTVAPYLLTGREARAAGVPWTTMAVGVLGMVVGFFAVPVVGLLLGGVLGIYLAEYARLRSGAAAWGSTLTVLKGIGLGIVLQLAAGVAMVLVWAVGLAAT